MTLLLTFIEESVHCFESGAVSLDLIGVKFNDETAFRRIEARLFE